MAKQQDRNFSTPPGFGGANTGLLRNPRSSGEQQSGNRRGGGRGRGGRGSDLMSANADVGGSAETGSVNGRTHTEPESGAQPTTSGRVGDRKSEWVQKPLASASDSSQNSAGTENKRYNRQNRHRGRGSGRGSSSIDGLAHSGFSAAQDGLVPQQTSAESKLQPTGWAESGEGKSSKSEKTDDQKNLESGDGKSTSPEKSGDQKFSESRVAKPSGWGETTENLRSIPPGFRMPAVAPALDEAIRKNAEKGGNGVEEATGWSETPVETARSNESGKRGAVRQLAGSQDVRRVAGDQNEPAKAAAEQPTSGTNPGRSNMSDKSSAVPATGWNETASAKTEVQGGGNQMQRGQTRRGGRGGQSDGRSEGGRSNDFSMRGGGRGARRPEAPPQQVARQGASRQQIPTASESSLVVPEPRSLGDKQSDRRGPENVQGDISVQPTGWSEEGNASSHSTPQTGQGRGLLGVKPSHSSNSDGASSTGSRSNNRNRGRRSEPREERNAPEREQDIVKEQERRDSQTNARILPQNKPSKVMGASSSKNPPAQTDNSINDLNEAGRPSSIVEQSVSQAAPQVSESRETKQRPQNAWQAPKKEAPRAKQGVIPAQGSRKELSRGVPLVPYLPQDEVEETGAVGLLNEVLSKLLQMEAPAFWKHVAQDPTLPVFLNSYLRFHKRPYDMEENALPEPAVSASERAQLEKRVFLVLYRLSCNQEGDLAPLSKQQHGDLLRKRNLLSAPQLMDIAAIYGHSNPELTRKLVGNVIENQPHFLDGITACVDPILNTLSSMRARSMAAVDALLKQHSATQDVPRVRHDLNEVIDYVTDVAATLGALVAVYPQVASCLVTDVKGRTSKETLLVALASAHDELLPAVLHGLKALAKSSADISLTSAARAASEQRRAQRARAKLAQLAWLLLDAKFFGGLEKAGRAAPRGAELLQALASMAEESGKGFKGLDAGRRGALLRTLDRRRDLRGLLKDLQAGGEIESAQLEHVELLLGPPAAKRQEKKAGESASASKSAAGSMDADEEALQRSKISQIKDVLPEYGDGFLAVCLDAYDNDPEQVLAHLLDGNLPPTLASLDTSMAHKPRPQAEPQLGVKDKGKAKLVEEEVQVEGGESSGARAEVKRTSTNQTGRYVRRDRTAADAKSLLDAREKGNERLREIANEYEYEDEYDDSFDELTTFGTEADDEEGLDAAVAKIRGGQRGTVTATGGEGSAPPNRKKVDAPQFYVKDGKNYSYKVAGSVAVNSAEEAVALQAQEKDLIHGLGAGGNVPDANTPDEEEEETEGGGESRGESRGGRGRGSFARKEQNKSSIANHRRKDRATSKFIKSVGGF